MKKLLENIICWRCGKKDNLYLHLIDTFDWFGEEGEKDIVLCEECRDKLMKWFKYGRNKKEWKVALMKAKKFNKGKLIYKLGAEEK